MARISGRFACSNCGALYHDTAKPLKVEGTCDACGSKEFTRRADDKPGDGARPPEVLSRADRTLLPYYRSKSVLITVDGMAEIDDVSAELAKRLDGAAR